MATKKNKLKSMSKEELQKEVVTLREKVRVIRFNAEGSKSKNVKEARTLKREVARALTLLKQADKNKK